jgi:protein-S-isoprenylcysteine O-methyltransferase Ste14
MEPNYENTLCLERLLYVGIAQIMLLLISISPSAEKIIQSLPSKKESDNTDDLPKDTDAVIGGAKFALPFVKHFIVLVLVIGTGLHNIYQFSDAGMSTIDTILLMGVIAFGLLRLLCYYYLGDYFTYNLCIQPGHKLIQEGPYRNLVHPSYLGQIGCIFCYLLLVKAWVVCLFIVPYTIYVAMKRMDLEEKMMLEHFGDQYHVFLNTRHRLLPGIY